MNCIDEPIEKAAAPLNDCRSGFFIMRPLKNARAREWVHASVHPAPGDVVQVSGEAFRVTGWQVKAPGGLSGIDIIRIAEVAAGRRSDQGRLLFW